MIEPSRKSHRDIHELVLRLEDYTENDPEQARVEYAYHGPELVAVIKQLVQQIEDGYEHCPGCDHPHL